MSCGFLNFITVGYINLGYVPLLLLDKNSFISVKVLNLCHAETDKQLYLNAAFGSAGANEHINLNCVWTKKVLYSLSLQVLKKDVPWLCLGRRFV